jgi:hypothetical protein
MLLIATCRKLRPVLHLHPFSYFARGIRDLEHLDTMCSQVTKDQLERLTDGEIITISILYFDISFKYSLHLLNFEGTRCLTG